MTENQNNQQDQSNPWDDVASQFKAFGESLSEAVNNSWNDPKTQEVIQQIKTGLNEAVDEIDEAIGSIKQDPKMQSFVDDAKDTFDQLEETGKDAVEQARPHILKAMESLSDALNKSIDGFKNNDETE